MVYTANQNITNIFDYLSGFCTNNSYQYTYQCIQSE